MGGSIPHLHGRKGHACGQSAGCRQEATGPVQALCLCQRDWRFSTGEQKWMKAWEVAWDEGAGMKVDEGAGSGVGQGMKARSTQALGL